MVKIKRDQYFVWPDRYYIWTYFPKKYQKSIDIVSRKSLYKKHYTCIPFFTRKHAKHVACFYHGVKCLSYIHIISGKNLIKKGITTFNRSNGVAHYQKCCFIKDSTGKWYPAALRQWVYPPEFLIDSHRRRRYIILLNKVFQRGGKKAFNKKYLLLNHGNAYRRIEGRQYKSQIVINRNYLYSELFLTEMKNEATKLELKGESVYPLELVKYVKQFGGGKIKSREVIKINSKEDFNTLLEEVKQFNNDFKNKREGLYLFIGRE